MHASPPPVPRRARSAANRLPGGAARLLLLSLLLPGLLATTAPAGDPQPREFAFPERNGLYPDLQVALEPQSWGPISMRLSSPQAALRLSDHLLRLTPRPDGSHHAWVEARFSGAGTLEADLEVSGLATRKTDQVLMPRQLQTVQGTLRLERGLDAYLVTPLELPRQVRLQIQSRMAGDLADWCAAIPLIGLTGADCTGLRKALSRVSIPLPPPGETYLLPYAELTPGERQLLDDYLDEAAALWPEQNATQ